jgi:hypothetical protein
MPSFFSSWISLRSGALVLDQNGARLIGFVALSHRPLQIRIVHPLPQNVEQVDLLVLDAPDRTHAVVRQFRFLAGGIPALNYQVESFWQLMGFINRDP